MNSLISGIVTGTITAGTTMIAAAIGDNSPVTIGLAVGASCLVYYITKEFTKLSDEVRQLQKDVSALKDEQHTQKRKNHDNED
jgi:uncharacterized protein (DUF342 family)